MSKVAHRYEKEQKEVVLDDGLDQIQLQSLDMLQEQKKLALTFLS